MREFSAACESLHLMFNQNRIIWQISVISTNGKSFSLVFIMLLWRQKLLLNLLRLSRVVLSNIYQIRVYLVVFAILVMTTQIHIILCESKRKPKNFLTLQIDRSAAGLKIRQMNRLHQSCIFIFQHT